MKIFSDKKKSLGEQYLSELATRVDPRLIEEVSTAIQSAGRWERTEEWRISTYITSWIEPIELEGQKWYRVTVENGTDTSCVCPTINRAIEYLYVLERVTIDLFWALGWSSWAEKARLKAEPNEI